MKKNTILVASAFAIITFLISWKATSDSGTIHADSLSCYILDGNGQPYLIENGGSATITTSGKATYKCQASGVPNSTGKTVSYEGVDFYGGQYKGVVTSAGQANWTFKYGF